MECGLAILLTRAQNHFRKMWMIRGIGVMLGFEAEPGVPTVSAPLLSGDSSIEMVTGVELNARFGGRHLEDPSG